LLYNCVFWQTFQPATSDAATASRDVNRSSSAADEAPKRKKKKKKSTASSQRTSANEDATATEVGYSSYY